MSLATIHAMGAEPPLDEARVVVRNVSTRYLALAVEMIVGLLVLPYNVAHLGKAAYGLWILTTSITAYFSVLDLGYSGAVVKFVAHYRAKRDVTALNEILSTMGCAFSAFGLLTYLAALVVAVYLDRLFQLSPQEVQLGRAVLLVVSVNVAAGTAFSVFGGVINGFQRYDLNNVVGAVSSVLVAIVNVLVLAAGYGLVELVVATTIVRLLTYWAYRANAYRVFPGLRLRLRSFSVARLKEVTSFSVYMLLIDWANKVNYAVDAVVIGIFLNTGAVALWSVSQRLAETTQRLTNQLNDVLLPNVVDNDTASRLDGLQRIFLVGTRFSLATVVPLSVTLILLAQPLLNAWVGESFTESELREGAIVLQVLALAVLARIGSATSGTLLKGAGRHRLVAVSNVVTAAANLSLSVLLIGPFNLTGVAIGTLVPVSVCAMFVLFPAGCQRVELPLGRALAEAVWPAVWPGVVMAAFVMLSRPLWGASLPAIGAEACAAVMVYAITFLRFGVSPAERRFCVAEFLTWSRRPRLVATASERA